MVETPVSGRPAGRAAKGRWGMTHGGVRGSARPAGQRSVGEGRDPVAVAALGQPEAGTRRQRLRGFCSGLEGCVPASKLTRGRRRGGLIAGEDVLVGLVGPV